MEQFPISLDRRRGEASSVFINILLVLLVVIILLELTFFTRFKKFYVSGDSMYPTLVGAEYKTDVSGNRINSSGGDYVYCGSNDEDAGKLQAEYCIENLPENAKVLYMSGTLGMNHTTLRMNGFKDLLAAERPDVTIIAEQDGNYDRAKGMQITEDWIQSYDEFDAIVCANDQMALGAIEALKGARRLEGVQVLGVDAVEHRFASERHAQVLHREPQIRRALHKRLFVMMVVIMHMIRIVVCVLAVHDGFGVR